MPTMEDYTDAMMRGETGATLARSIGVPVPQGSSPPVITPTQAPAPPPARWISSANNIQVPPNLDLNPMYQNFWRNQQEMPIAEAQKAIAAAQQFQAMRGYQADLDKGTAPDQAFMRWAPVMFGGKMTGAGPFLKAMQPKPVQQEFIQQEIIPGIIAVGRPGGTGTQIIKRDGGDLSKKEKLDLLVKAGGMEKDLSIMSPDSQQYKNLLEIVNAIKSSAMSGGAPNQITPPAGMPTQTPTSGPTVKRYSWTPGGGFKLKTE